MASIKRMDERSVYRQGSECSLIARLGKPEEITSPTAFLTFDEAAFIIGHLLDVEGCFDVAGLL